MEPTETRRAIATAMSTATALGLSAEDATVLNDSNRLVLRLLPCDVVARVAPAAWQGGAEFEVDVVRRLTEAGSPVAALEPRVEPRGHIRDGFEVSLWTYYEPAASHVLPPAVYAHQLERLHAGMRQVDVPAPNFLDRVADTEQWVAGRDVTPDLADADRERLAGTLQALRHWIAARGAPEQLLHGEPHPWNYLWTRDGPLFIDFENAARGPVEYDLAWVPAEVCEEYPQLDRELLGECRGVVLAIIAAHRWRHDDQHPSGPERTAWLNAFLQGPPWPTLDVV